MRGFSWSNSALATKESKAAQKQMEKAQKQQKHASANFFTNPRRWSRERRNSVDSVATFKAPAPAETQSLPVTPVPPGSREGDDIDSVKLRASSASGVYTLEAFEYENDPAVEAAKERYRLEALMRLNGNMVVPPVVGGSPKVSPKGSPMLRPVDRERKGKGVGVVSVESPLARSVEVL
jgi:hypothetical protein